MQNLRGHRDVGGLGNSQFAHDSFFLLPFFIAPTVRIFRRIPMHSLPLCGVLANEVNVGVRNTKFEI